MRRFAGIAAKLLDLPKPASVEKPSTMLAFHDIGDAVPPMMARMFSGLHNPKVLRIIVKRVAILVMDKPTIRYWPVVSLPNLPMKRLVVMPIINAAMPVFMGRPACELDAVKFDCFSHVRIISP